MSGGTFDYLQYQIPELISMINECVWNYENAKMPSDIEYDLPVSTSRSSEIDENLVKNMKWLVDRLQRDFLWLDNLDKFLSGDIGKDEYMSKVDAILYEMTFEDGEEYLSGDVLDHF